MMTRLAVQSADVQPKENTMPGTRTLNNERAEFLAGGRSACFMLLYGVLASCLVAVL
jgi:hypothetical protein